MSTETDEAINKIIKEKFNVIGTSLGLDELCNAVKNEILRASGGKTKIITVVGGSGCGKSTLLRCLMRSIERADGVSADDYVVEDREYRRKHFEGGDPLLKYDFALMNQKVKQIRNNRDPNKFIAVPTYDEKTGVAIGTGEENYQHEIGEIDVLFVEGVFSSKVENPDHVIFVHASEKLRLQNQIERANNIRDEGGEEGVLKNFKIRQKFEYVPYVFPQAKKADLIIEVTKNNSKFKYNLFKGK